MLFTEPEHRDMQRAVAMFKKAAEQQVSLSSVWYNCTPCMCLGGAVGSALI